MLDLIHSPLGAIHTAAAVLALILGPVLFLRSKGDRAHRVLGYLYVISMLTVCLAGLPLRSFGGYSPFHVLSIVSLITIALGAVYVFAAARIVRSDKGRDGLVKGHLYWMAWSYIGLVAAGLSQIGSRVSLDLFGVSPGVAVFAASGVTIGFGAWLIGRQRPRLAVRYFPKDP